MSEDDIKKPTPEDDLEEHGELMAAEVLSFPQRLAKFALWLDEEISKGKLQQNSHYTTERLTKARDMRLSLAKLIQKMGLEVHNTLQWTREDEKGEDVEKWETGMQPRKTIAERAAQKKWEEENPFELSLEFMDSDVRSYSSPKVNTMTPLSVAMLKADEKRFLKSATKSQVLVMDYYREKNIEPPIYSHTHTAGMLMSIYYISEGAEPIDRDLGHVFSDFVRKTKAVFQQIDSGRGPAGGAVFSR